LGKYAFVNQRQHTFTLPFIGKSNVINVFSLTRVMYVQLKKINFSQSNTL
jgi:hypothetical protein